MVLRVTVIMFSNPSASGSLGGQRKDIVGQKSEHTTPSSQLSL